MVALQEYQSTWQPAPHHHNVFVICIFPHIAYAISLGRGSQILAWGQM